MVRTARGTGSAKKTKMGSAVPGKIKRELEIERETDERDSKTMERGGPSVDQSRSIRKAEKEINPKSMRDRWGSQKEEKRKEKTDRPALVCVQHVLIRVPDPP